jgi:hypothetical protein
LTNPTPPNLPSPNLTYGSARRELRDAIARRAVEARGFKEDKNRPPLAREALPPDLFQRFPSLAVDVFGETTFMHPSPTQNIPVWKGIVFYEPQVRALWPKPTPLLDQWMLEDVTRRPQEKRDTRIEDCRKATGCTVREAKAAYDRLPQDKKRSRGQRIEASTIAK